MTIDVELVKQIVTGGRGRQNALKTISQVTADFVVGLCLDEFPEDVVASAKLHILDTIGAMLDGSTAYIGEKIADFVISLEGPPQASLIGRDLKVSYLDAVLANAAATHCNEIDDIHTPSMVCAGGLVVPAILATVERKSISGRRFLEAAVAGYELATRAGMSVHSLELGPNGWWASTMCGALGSAAATAKLLNLDAEQVAHAIGIAGKHSGGFVVGSEEGPLAHYMLFGRATQNGVLAANLAARGFTGPSKIFEDRRSFSRAYSDSAELDRLTDGLGIEYQIAETSIKPYACGRHMQAAVDGFLDIISERGIGRDDVSRLVVRVPTPAMLIINRPTFPQNDVAAMLSAQYVLGLAALYGKILPEQFKQSRTDTQFLQEFIPKVRVLADSRLDEYRLDKWPAVVEMTTVGGEKLSREVLVPRGDPRNPLSKSDIENKFRNLAEPIVGPQRVAEIIDSVAKLEDLPDAMDLLCILRA